MSVLLLNTNVYGNDVDKYLTVNQRNYAQPYTMNQTKSRLYYLNV